MCRCVDGIMRKRIFFKKAIGDRRLVGEIDIE